MAKARKPLPPRHKLAIEGVLCVIIAMLAATIVFNTFERFQIRSEASESLDDGMGWDSVNYRLANRYVNYLTFVDGKMVDEEYYYQDDLQAEIAQWVEEHGEILDETIFVKLRSGAVYLQMGYVTWEDEQMLNPMPLTVAYVDVTPQLDMVRTVNITFVIIAFVGSIVAASIGNYMGAKIEEAEAAQKRFFENMSHELKTPVAAIRGYAEGIQAHIVEPEHAATSIVREAKRLRSIVDEIMSLSRLEAGAIKIETEEIEVADFVEDCLMPFENIAATKGLDVTLDLHEGTIQADEDLFSHALENVLSNAFRHAASSLCVRYIGQKLTVTNDGTMPSAEDVAHLFDRFHSSSTAEGGTGIGLALTKEIVELHGFKIGARITPENLMEVWIDFS